MYSHSEHSKQLATDYLIQYKFKDWTCHRTNNPGTPVSDDEKKERASQLAESLCSLEKWNSHSHAIHRDILIKEVRIDIDYLEGPNGENRDLERAVDRLWAMVNYLFDITAIFKVYVSRTYRLARIARQADPSGGNA